MTKKVKIIIIIFFLILGAYTYYQITKHTLIPDHIHSIDDKPEEQRTDEDKIIILERTLQKDPDNVQAMIQISDLYIKNNNNKKAKEYLNKALELEPNNQQVINRLKRSDN